MDQLTIAHKGCTLHYRVVGDGPPVVFIQGVAVHGDGWRPQVEGLSSRFRCLTFDNRGMGLSQPIGTSLSVEQMAEDARIIMDAQGWNSAHVVGHSLGGLVALAFAHAFRDRVRSLSLLCTFANGKHAAPLTWRMMWVGMRTRVGTRRMRRRAFLRLIMPDEALARTNWPALAEQLAPLFGHDLGEQPPITSKQLKAMRAYDATTHLPAMAGIPTLVLNGLHDPIAPPRVGRAIADGIPGASYVEWADASHGAPIQFAERLNSLLIEHLNKADASH